MGSLSSPRIWYIPPSAKAGMNRSLQTCIPLVSKGERQGEEQSKKDKTEEKAGAAWGK